MSSVGQALGGIVGGVVGFFTPLGLVYGAQIGMMVGGVLDPPRTEGPRLEDLTAQTSVYGAFIPRLYGTTAVTGNVIWIQGDKLIEHSHDEGGKGGPTVTTFEYFATFAVGLCEGPIDGVRRIWIGGQLWYDAGSDDISTIIASNEVAARFTLYTGTDTQLADPLIQADRVAANVPAYRGLAYLVFEELPLKDYGNSLVGAQVKVEVVKDGSTTGFRELSNFTENNPYQYASVMSRAFYYAEPFVYYTMPLNDSRLANGLLDIRALDLTTNTSSVVGHSIPISGSTWGTASGKSDVMKFGSHDQEPGYIGVSGLDEYSGLSASYDRYAIQNNWYYTVDRSTGSMLGFDMTRMSDGPKITYTAPIEIDATTYANSWAVEASESHVYFGMTNGSGDPVIFKFDRRNAEHVATATPSTSIGGFSVIGDDEIYFPVSTSLYLTADFFATSTNIGTGSWIDNNRAVFGWGLFKIAEGVVAVCKDNPNNISVALYQWSPTITPAIAQLGDIVQSECLQSGLLTAGDLDVTELTDQVRGYRISSLSPLRGGIDQLRKAWPFDAIQHGYKILFKKRGGGSVATITEGELDAREAGANPGVRISNVREMDLIMPQQLTVQYMDATREYDVNVAEESR
jgi:hypothetical protein